MLIRPLLLLALLGAPAGAEESFSSTIQGISLRPEIGTAIYGYEASGNLGITSAGTRVFQDGKYLLQWNGRAEALGGMVAFRYPFYPIYGAGAGATAEAGIRLFPASFMSPWISLGAGVDGSAVTRFGVPFNGGPSNNNLDGLGGVVGDVVVRASAGAAMLGSWQALVGGLGLRMDLSSPGANVPARAFFGADLHARYDLHGLIAQGEASLALAPPEHDPALGVTSFTDRWVLSVSALKTLGDHVFVGVGARVRRDSSSVVYDPGLTYVTHAPVDSRIWATVGVMP
jgi:hypothetical protein